MTNKSLLHHSRGSTSFESPFIHQYTWSKKSSRSRKSTLPPIQPFISVRSEKQIPPSVLDFFKIDPRTHQPYTLEEKIFNSQVFMHEIDEGTRLLLRANKLEEAKILNDFSNKMHFANRLDLLRKLLEDPAVTSLPPEHIQRLHKARNNQWGAIKTQFGSNKAIAVTETGIGYKERNEDAYLVMEQSKVMAFADGMGGHVAGHIASCIAIDFFEYGVTKGMEIDNAIAFANEAILSRSKNDEKLGGMHPMGCTFAAVQLKNSLLKIAHVGDTKVMVLRNGGIHFETQDHTQGQQLLKEGFVDYKTAFELNHILNRCLGTDYIRAKRDVAVTSLLLKPGDRVLIATDGLTDNFFSEDFRLEDLAKLSSQGSLLQAANLLMDSCLSRMLASSLPDGRPAKSDNVSLGMLECHT
jgi:PPM family protein phosphatase